MSWSPFTKYSLKKFIQGKKPVSGCLAFQFNCCHTPRGQTMRSDDHGLWIALNSSSPVDTVDTSERNWFSRSFNGDCLWKWQYCLLVDVRLIFSWPQKNFDYLFYENALNNNFKTKKYVSYTNRSTHNRSYLQTVLKNIIPLEVPLVLGLLIINQPSTVKTFILGADSQELTRAWKIYAKSTIKLAWEPKGMLVWS